MRLLYLNQYLKIDSDTTIIRFIYAISFNFIELDKDIKLFKSEHSKLRNLNFITVCVQMKLSDLKTDFIELDCNKMTWLPLFSLSKNSMLLLND